MGYLNFGPEDYLEAYQKVRRPKNFLTPRNGRNVRCERCRRTFVAIKYQGSRCIACRVRTGELQVSNNLDNIKR